MAHDEVVGPMRISPEPSNKERTTFWKITSLIVLSDLVSSRFERLGHSAPIDTPPMDK